MKIAKMTKGSWGNVRAFFSIETAEGLIVTGFKLVEHEGLFVGFPSAKNKDDEYKDTVMSNKECRMKLNKLAHDFYHQDDRPQRVSGGMSEVARLEESTDYADKDDKFPY